MLLNCMVIQCLKNYEIEMWYGHPDLYVNKLEDIFITSDDSDIGYFVEVDLRYTDEIKEKIKHFPLLQKINYVMKINLCDYMKKIKPDTFTQNKKLICDWTNKMKYLIH